jgi:hypothetical protein
MMTQKIPKINASNGRSLGLHRLAKGRKHVKSAIDVRTADICSEDSKFQVQKNALIKILYSPLQSKSKNN